MTVTTRAPADLDAPHPGHDGGPDAVGCGELEGLDSPSTAVGSGPARAAVALIRLYQLARTGRTSPCRFVPTCSQYAASAIERHGLRRGLRLALGRLARCRPRGPFGSDPVPE